MKPTVDDVLTALELMSARVPDRHITPDVAMAAVWIDDLARFERAAIFAAARSWSGLRFPAASEFFAECQNAARLIAAEEAARYSAGELETVACPEGCSHGWIDGTEEHRGMKYATARPCELHMPVAYAVWRHRTARPDHDPDRCPDCIQIKSGKDPAPAWLAEAREVAARAHRPVEPAF